MTATAIRPMGARPDRKARRRLRARGRGALRNLGVVLIVAGIALLADAGVTLVWQEPVTAAYTTVRQHELAGQLATLQATAPSLLAVDALRHLRSTPQRIAYLARELARRAPEGSAVGRIEIARIGADFVLVKGTTLADLRSGPGIYPQTGFPGVRHTTAIAGHRTTYLAPFRHIDALRTGDLIVVAMPYARFTYSVTTHRVVAPNDWRVIEQARYSRIVLTACTPLFSPAKRLVVVARLIRTQPLGAAREL